VKSDTFHFCQTSYPNKAAEIRKNKLLLRMLCKGCETTSEGNGEIHKHFKSTENSRMP
jgi:hypothetical protein